MDMSNPQSILKYIVIFTGIVKIYDKDSFRRIMQSVTYSFIEFASFQKVNKYIDL
jgi:hypothetical protein